MGARAAESLTLVAKVWLNIKNKIYKQISKIYVQNKVLFARVQSLLKFK